MERLNEKKRKAIINHNKSIRDESGLMPVLISMGIVIEMLQEEDLKYYLKHSVFERQKRLELNKNRQ